MLWLTQPAIIRSRIWSCGFILARKPFVGEPLKSQSYFGGVFRPCKQGPRIFVNVPDANRKQLYLSCGEGFLDTIQQTTSDSYQRVSKVPTAAGARTAFFSLDLDRLYLAVPARGTQEAELRVYQPQ